MLEAGHTIIGVVSDDAAVSAWAQTRELRLIDPQADLVAALGADEFDYLFSIANLRLLPPEVVSLPSRAAINFHDGPLPKYAGLHATSWALINGEQSHGVTWHGITDEVDAGAIFQQRMFDVTVDETAYSLNTKCFEAGIETFRDLIAELASGAHQVRPQDLSARTYFGRWARPAAAGIISFQNTAAEISALVRGLDFGPTQDNPLAAPKILIGDELLVCPVVDAIDPGSGLPPGTVTHVDAHRLVVSTREGDVAFTRLMTQSGEQLPIKAARERYGLQVGTRLAGATPETLRQLTEFHRTTARHERFWVNRLADLHPAVLPYQGPGTDGAPVAKRAIRTGWDMRAFLSPESGTTPAHHVAAGLFAIFVARLTGEDRFDLALAGVDPLLPESAPAFAAEAPWRIEIDGESPSRAEVARAGESLASTLERQTYLRDIWTRSDDLRRRFVKTGRPHLRVAISLDAGEDVDFDNTEADIVFQVASPSDWWLWHDPDSVSTEDAGRLVDQFQTMLRAVAEDPDRTVHGLPIVPEPELGRLQQWNDTEAPFAAEAIHEQIERTAAEMPDATAVISGTETLTYSELNRRANQLARHLRARGVGPETVVAVALERSNDLLVAVVGIQKAGGAYLPLDLSYPRDRLSFILGDAEAAAIITTSSLIDTLPDSDARVVALDLLAPELRELDDTNLRINVAPDCLAYLIYTSGSTGLPKGVMVEHRNVASFFFAMDERIPRRSGNVWLALTTLSFDISVLELLWTLSRGLTVVVAPDQDRLIGMSSEPSTTPIDFSLFYFSADQGEDPHDKYRLLREGAVFADTHGFSAVWTPERHFHEFGGLYPNPSVTGAAVAMITDRIRIRSGSVVAPLHSPIRIAEEWSVVDNLSDGRVDLAFASGWMPDDFAIRPDDYVDRKQATFRHVEAVRSLWRGESLDFPGPDGSPVRIRTLPTPIQPELPVWITAAGNPETFIEAGRLGAHVLTHLLGQTLDEVRDKIAAYRRAWREAGHPGAGHVSLMVHTFVTDSHESARQATREPLREYLRTSANLLRSYSAAFPTFRTGDVQNGEVNFGDLPSEDLDDLLDFAFDRYFETSGLFGTPESCRATIERMKQAGIDEVACLIDFGIPSPLVLDNLTHLNALKELANPQTDAEESISDLIERNSVTHLQCTPTMAQVLLADPPSAEALRGVEVMMVGGEACPPHLAEQLSRTVDGRVMNMYGPTETTIWSTTHVLRPEDHTVPIGRPILNTRAHVVNRAFETQPIGVTGELLIGGPGVTRGYFKRPELTEERFIPDPFAGDATDRVYRTGDLARYLPDGSLEFLGRIDHQVKIRGHRIELGEIEAVLGESPGVREAVVTARPTDNGDRRLVAYVTLDEGSEPNLSELRAHLQHRLPQFMVPAHIVHLDGLPLTPNKKIDRKALPPPDEVGDRSHVASEPPEGEVESKVAAIWADVLGGGSIGRTDNFFEVGGDSLSLIRVTSRLGDVFQQKVSVGAFVRSPTVKDVAALLAGSSQGLPEQPSPAADSDDELSSRRMRLEDLDDVVAMHLKEFPDWRSSMLGARFVRKQYEWFMHRYGDLALVAVHSDEIVGFTVGTVGSYRATLLRFASGELIRSMLRHPIRFGRLLLRTREMQNTEAAGPRDAHTANNRIMASAPGASDAGLTLLMAFEAAADRRGVEAFFHDQHPEASRPDTEQA